MSRVVRCAVYTRKSTDEGLDQSFNSLDAQREACEAYIKSQVGEGWRALPANYDDGGFSGGTLNRPSMQRLLDDVDAGKVDVIVVYKVDRLTRSLMDFAKIVERLDAHGVSFVSVTQAFNTTSSMGRLTLNVLLSFAQFEREVTGERIRDKIAASKARGMWMGGNVPLGYNLENRKLIVNVQEAAQVRHIFARYLELRSGVELTKELNLEGFVSKRWINRSGQERGGKSFSCGALYYLLQNRLYVGEIAHKGQRHPGDHPALIEPEVFNEVQQLIAANRKQRKSRQTRAAECQLVGLVFERDQQPLTTSFSYGRGGRMYRYYVSPDLLPSSAIKAVRTGQLRVPAGPLERLVLGSLSELLGNSLEWAQTRELLVRIELWDRSVQLILDPAKLLEPGEQISALASRLSRPCAAARLIAEDKHLRLIHDRAPSFRGGSRQSVSEIQPRCQVLAHEIRRAHRLLEENASSPFAPEKHSEAVAPTSQRDRLKMHLGLISPALQKGLLSGSLTRINDPRSLPLAWADQERTQRVL